MNSIGKTYTQAYNLNSTSTVTFGLTTRGYTLHEHLDKVNLINMPACRTLGRNGRLYDPLTARMLSPDNFVQDATTTQNFNRYSYCLNNPLKYTDPDGEFIHLIIGAIIGGTINWIANGAEFSWKGLGYFGVGALAGALGAGIGSGIMAASAGSTFGAGFLGTQSAMTAISASYTSSFLSGAAIGGASGFAGGFVTGTGNALMQGEKFGNALWSGTKTGLIAGASGALLGGVMGGIDAVGDERNFWTGDDIGTGRSPFAFNNTNKPFNAYRTSKGGYEFRNNIDRYINNPDGPYSNRVMWGNHTDEYGFSTGNVSRMNNYLMPGEDPLNLSIDKFVGQSNLTYSGTIPNGCTVQISFDGNVVTTLQSGNVMMNSMVVPANIQNVGIQYIGNPLSGQTISPFRSIITGYVRWP